MPRRRTRKPNMPNSSTQRGVTAAEVEDIRLAKQRRQQQGRGQIRLAKGRVQDHADFVQGYGFSIPYSRCYLTLLRDNYPPQCKRARSANKSPATPLPPRKRGRPRKAVAATAEPLVIDSEDEEETSEQGSEQSSTIIVAAGAGGMDGPASASSYGRGKRTKWPTDKVKKNMG